MGLLNAIAHPPVKVKLCVIEIIENLVSVASAVAFTVGRGVEVTSDHFWVDPGNTGLHHLIYDSVINLTVGIDIS